MVEIKQDMWGRCSEHLLGENKNTNTNTISLIHLRIGTYFISRRPHWSHESPHLLAGSQCCRSCFHDNPDASLLQSLTYQGIHSKINKGECEPSDDSRKCFKMLIQDSKLAENTVWKQPIHHRSYFCNRTWLNFPSTSLWIKTFPV